MDDPDQQLHEKINALVTEEHRLERSHPGRALTEPERERLGRIGVELDRLWDLLRRRDARRRAGLDPDAAAERPADMVEDYWQ